MRGVGHRHERAVRCGGRETCARRARVTRTAKSCGPDAAVLASSCVVAHRSFGSSAISMRRRWQKSRSPGRARSKPYSHCAGKAGVFPLNLYARVRLCLRTLHTRPRVQRAPGLPCALSSSEGQRSKQTSGLSSREKAKSYPRSWQRACARLTAPDHILEGNKKPFKWLDYWVKNA